MLIEDYDLEVASLPCEPGSEQLAAMVRLRTDISIVLPYLNRTLRGTIYYVQAPSLVWNEGGGSVAFWPFKIAIGHVEDRWEAQKVAQRLVDLVNRTWEGREKIEPDTETHQRPAPMALYQLLPHTNCKTCGQPTCFAFALKLAIAQVRLEDCPPLIGPQYAEQRARLAELIPVDAPPSVQRNRNDSGDAVTAK